MHAELGFTVNIGVSENKLLAKMASDFTKPDHVHTLWKSEMSEKMWHLPVGDLFYVGHASLYKLKKLGFHTIGELAAMDPAILRAHMKSQGILIWQYANGIDESAVISSPRRPKAMEILSPRLMMLWIVKLPGSIFYRYRKPFQPG